MKNTKQLREYLVYLTKWDSSSAIKVTLTNIDTYGDSYTSSIEINIINVYQMIMQRNIIEEKPYSFDVFIKTRNRDNNINSLLT